MKENVFKSDRYFVTFDVLVSHGQLLLRSQKNEQYQYNIDIVFFDTVYMQLFNRLKGVAISLASDQNVIKYNAVKQYLKYDNNTLFQIESEGEIYYIAAAFVRVFENDLDFVETSLGFENKSRGREIATLREIY